MIKINTLYADLMRERYMNTLRLAQNIVNLVHTNEYKDQCTYLSVNEKNWIKLPQLKTVMGLDCIPGLTVYMSQISAEEYDDETCYVGEMEFKFTVPNRFGTDDVTSYNFPQLLSVYGNLRAALYSLLFLVNDPWEELNGAWDGFEDTYAGFDASQAQYIPIHTLAERLDPDDQQLMQFMLVNMLGRSWDEEGWEMWNFLRFNDVTYIAIRDYYDEGMIPLQEFLYSPLTHQQLTHLQPQLPTLCGIVAGAKAIW